MVSCVLAIQSHLYYSKFYGLLQLCYTTKKGDAMAKRLWHGIEYSRQRQTEWAAGWYHRDGRVMMMTHDGIVTLVPPRFITKKQAVLDVKWLEAPQRQHALCYGQVCADCEERKPLSDYHQDSRCATGHKTICKGCRCRVERNRYRAQIGRQPRKYRIN
jgi:hypothetical protein